MNTDRFSSSVLLGLHAGDLDFSRPLLLALSGGPDSTALLLACHALSGRQGPDVIAAHFDHQLRPESTSDAAYVRKLCRSLGVRLISGKGDVAAYAKQHSMSVETAAREMRYDFLARASARLDAQGVATGHTLDDQAETVLMHLVRGSGARGLTGMRPVSVREGRSVTHQHNAIAPLRIFRPLLAVRHSEAVAYCRDRGVTPLDDASNRDLRFARNRVRLKVLPELEMLNSRAPEAIARMSDTVVGDLAALDELLQPVIDEVTSRKPGASASRRALVGLHHAVAMRVLIDLYRRAAGTTDGLERVHLLSMLEVARTGAGRTVELPGGLVFETTHTQVTVQPSTLTRLNSPFAPLALSVPGIVTLPDSSTIAARIVRAPRSISSDSADTAYLSLDLTDWPLTVRFRKNGDRFRPIGMDVDVKLQDFFVGQHVPRQERDTVPLVVSDRGIAWVAGHRPADWAKLEPGDTTALRVELKRSQKMSS